MFLQKDITVTLNKMVEMNRKAISLKLWCVFVLIFCCTTAFSQERPFREHEVIDVGGGQKVEILRCRGDGPYEECDCIYYTTKRQLGTRSWQNANRIREEERAARIARNAELGVPQNTSSMANSSRRNTPVKAASPAVAKVKENTASEETNEVLKTIKEQNEALKSQPYLKVSETNRFHRTPLVKPRSLSLLEAARLSDSLKQAGKINGGSGNVSSPSTASDEIYIPKKEVAQNGIVAAPLVPKETVVGKSTTTIDAVSTGTNAASREPEMLATPAAGAQQNAVKEGQSIQSVVHTEEKPANATAGDKPVNTGSQQTPSLSLTDVARSIDSLSRSKTAITSAELASKDSAEMDQVFIPQKQIAGTKQVQLETSTETSKKEEPVSPTKDTVGVTTSMQTPATAATFEPVPSTSTASQATKTDTGSTAAVNATSSTAVGDQVAAVERAEVASEKIRTDSSVTSTAGGNERSGNTAQTAGVINTPLETGTNAGTKTSAVQSTSEKTAPGKKEPSVSTGVSTAPAVVATSTPELPTASRRKTGSALDTVQFIVDTNDLNDEVANKLINALNVAGVKSVAATENPPVKPASTTADAMTESKQVEKSVTVVHQANASAQNEEVKVGEPAGGGQAQPKVAPPPVLEVKKDVSVSVAADDLANERFSKTYGNSKSDAANNSGIEDKKVVENSIGNASIIESSKAPEKVAAEPSSSKSVTDAGSNSASSGTNPTKTTGTNKMPDPSSYLVTTEVNVKGEWRKAIIIEKESEYLYKVHYEGKGPEFDEWVANTQLRKIDSTRRTFTSIKELKSRTASSESCSFKEPAPHVSHAAKFSETVAKRKIYENVISAAGWNRKGRVLGVTFLYFQSEEPYVNSVSVNASKDIEIKNDLAPAGAMVYPVRTKFTICEKGSGETSTKVVDRNYACFRNTLGQWVCALSR